MKRLLSAFLLAVGSASTALAQSPEQKPAPTTSVTAIAGISNDNLRWNIAGNMEGRYPNVLSELTWKNVQSANVGVNFSHFKPVGARGHGLRLDAQVMQGNTFAGDNQDDDWAEDNRTAKFSQSNNDASGGSSLSGRVSVGATVAVPSFSVLGIKIPRIEITPMAGNTWSHQRFVMTDGYQTFSDWDGDGETDYTGPFDGLNASYTTNWNGRFIGAQGSTTSGRHTVTFSHEYQWLNYEGTGVWNLRDDLRQDPSFLHTATGAALRTDLGYALDWGPGKLTANFTSSLRVAGPGVDRIFFADAVPDWGAFAETRLNEVISRTKTLAVGYKMSW